MGQLFEQWVGLELIRMIYQSHGEGRLRFWRDPDGPEVDWVLDKDDCYVPIDVKWSEAPTLLDVRHLERFIQEYPQAKAGFVICRTPRRFKLGPRITALPWQDLLEVEQS